MGGANVWLSQTIKMLRCPQRFQVYGDKDADGFYRGETCARLGLIPCNMVSEIHADDEEMMDQLLRQGFLPLNTPVEKIGARNLLGSAALTFRATLSGVDGGSHSSQKHGLHSTSSVQFLGGICYPLPSCWVELTLQASTATHLPALGAFTTS